MAGMGREVHLRCICTVTCLSPVSRRDLYIYSKAHSLSTRALGIAPRPGGSGLPGRHVLDWLRRPSPKGPHWLHYGSTLTKSVAPTSAPFG